MNFSGCFTQNDVVQYSQTTIPTRPSCSSGSQLSETTSIIQIGPTQPKLWKIPWQLFYLDILAHSQIGRGVLFAFFALFLVPWTHLAHQIWTAHVPWVCWHTPTTKSSQITHWPCTGHIYQVVLDVLGHNSATMGLICQLLADYQCQDQDPSCDTFG